METPPRDELLASWHHISKQAAWIAGWMAAHPYFLTVPLSLPLPAQAGDDVCDDGRTSSPSSYSPRLVMCDLGTDCDDCGVWEPSGPAPWLAKESPGVGPVAFLKGMNMEVCTYALHSQGWLTVGLVS